MASEATPFARSAEVAPDNTHNGHGHDIHGHEHGHEHENEAAPVAIGRSHPAVGKCEVPRVPFHILAYFGAATIYTAMYATIGRSQTAEVQNSYSFVLCLVLWDIHFIKRCLEVFFVHKYGKKHVPFFESFGEQVVYLGFAAGCGYTMHASFSATSASVLRWGNPPIAVKAVFACLFLLGVLGNGICHWLLAHNDRKKVRLFVFISFSSSVLLPVCSVVAALCCALLSHSHSRSLCFLLAGLPRCVFVQVGHVPALSVRGHHLDIVAYHYTGALLLFAHALCLFQHVCVVV